MNKIYHDKMLPCSFCNGDMYLYESLGQACLKTARLMLIRGNYVFVPVAGCVELQLHLVFFYYFTDLELTTVIRWWMTYFFRD